MKYNVFQNYNLFLTWQPRKYKIVFNKVVGFFQSSKTDSVIKIQTLLSR
jgi:hypothetical protein